ncbi:MAG: MFS transporter [Christensenellales bacterium]|jgi:maltose/moltooligosaccharide transporter
MKLNYKNTIKVGFAFAIIMLFWQAYDFVVPLLLDNIYGLPDDIRGLIMGLDNLLSLFLLPLFGNLSDRHNSKRGKRTPFIIMGTIASVVLLIFVPLCANMQKGDAYNLRQELSSKIDSVKLAEFYDNAKSGDNTKYCDYEYLNRSGISRDTYINLKLIDISEEKSGDTVKYYKTTDGVKVEIQKTEYDELIDTNAKYKRYAQAGINTYLSDEVYNQITKKNLTSLILYMIVLFFVLVAMATFRSPAVALMPDVTPKPLRSQANAIINLAGGFGAALAFIIYTVWLEVNETAYLEIFITVGIGMLVLLITFLRLVNEPQLAEQCRLISEEYGIREEEEEQEAVKTKMEKDKKASFLLILGSIFMWFMGYNAVTSNLSLYATRNLLYAPSMAGIITAISMGVSALAFIPVGYLAVKIGRKKSIIIGFALATVSFFLIFLFVRPDWTKILFAVFYLIAGFGLIIANVNTFPMVVELSKEGDVGKYTGFYYTATMSAQAITPYIAGLFMKIKPEYLFIYSTVCVIVAIVLMSFVKHGDSKPVPPESKLEMMSD